MALITSGHRSALGISQPSHAVLLFTVSDVSDPNISTIFHSQPSGYVPSVSVWASVCTWCECQWISKHLKNSLTLSSPPAHLPSPRMMTILSRCLNLWPFTIYNIAITNTSGVYVSLQSIFTRGEKTIFEWKHRLRHSQQKEEAEIKPGREFVSNM